MESDKVNSFVSLIRPPEGVEPLSRYLAAVGRALGVASDAQLARILNVPPPTIASWKRRGNIPPDRVGWFAESLIPKIARTWDDLPQVGKTARAAVVELTVRRGGNPLEASRFPILTTAQSLGGLFALAEFLANLRGLSPHVLNSDEVTAIADLMAEGMDQFRQGAGLVAEHASG